MLARTAGVIAVMFLVGCGGGPGDGLTLGRVEGVVTLDGEPLPNAHVAFAPIGSEGATSLAKTDEAGHYDLRYKRDMMGAVVGKHSVRIWTIEDEGDQIDEATGLPIPRPKEIVPKKYNEETELVETVEETNQTVNFDLLTK